VSLIDPIVSNVALEWSHPGNGPMLEEEARYFTLVRLDPRGSGLSDRQPPTSLDEGLLDIEAVVDRLGLERFALHVNTSATPFAVAFAARYPERVARLVIIDGLLRSADLNASPQVEAFLAAAAADWETATEVIGAIAFGVGREETRVHGEYVRACVNPEYFAATSQFRTLDVSDLAASLRMPVMVVRHLGYRLITDEMTNHLMSCIPDARLVTVKGMWPDDIEGLVRRMAAFVYEGEELPAAARPTPQPPSVTRSSTALILFADIVDSTGLTERMGDGAFRERARALDDALRAAIRDAGGTAIDGKLLGDGVLATFPAASQAIDAAFKCNAAAEATDEGRAEALRLRLHIGIHAGDVIREANNVYGGAVNIASRISGLSAPGDVLVSDVVRALARTSAGVTFEDRGEHALKGVADLQRVYSVRKDGR
jgi:class 3 adenylate cyclase